MTSDSRCAEITLAGRRGIREAAQTHAELFEAVKAHKDIIVDCSDVAEADLAFIQLLIAAGRSAAQLGGRVSVRHSVEGALHKALKRGGFLAGAKSGGLEEADDPLAWMQASRADGVPA